MHNMNFSRPRTASCLTLLLLLPLLGQAQWLTQSLNLKSGWNAAYLHVDASHDTLDNLIGADPDNPILEVWLWVPSRTTMQFIQSPQQPVEGAQWLTWSRNAGGARTLQRLVGNAAYLVRVGSNVATHTWAIQGKPVTPAYEWTTTGMNFIGFPSGALNPPTFDAFLSQAPDLQMNAEIYHYPGGELGTGNPARLYALRTARVNRGQAYWIRAGSLYNRYYAPFEVALSGSQGVSFGDRLAAASFRLRNLTASNITVTLRLLASESPPVNQQAIVGTPPLLVRGALNTTNLTYASTNLPANGTHTWTLAAKGLPGSETEVVLGLDRSLMSGSVGDLWAGILRLSDSLGFSQVDLPLSATVASRAGLWVGAVSVTRVGEYLKTYDRDSANGVVADTNGQYVVSGISTNLGGVSKPYPLRLIVHNPASGPAVLLQRVFVGIDEATNSVVTLQESTLHAAYLSQARRISAAHLPWTPTNRCWAFDGALDKTNVLKVRVSLEYNDQASNPFLHTYHPDHDNLDTNFRNELQQGAESYSIRRDITLTVTPASGSSAAFSTSAQAIGGEYAETVTLLGLPRAGGAQDTRTYQVQGVFTLNRVSPVANLTSR
jgi:hypothetical protein